MCFAMDGVRFILIFLITKKFANASIVLTSSPEKATVGVDFTFTCTTSVSFLYFRRGTTRECSIFGVYPNGTCKFGIYNPKYTYDCDNSNGVYKLTIPSSFDIDTLHGSSWKCIDAVEGNASDSISLYVYTSITQVNIETSPTDKNPIEIISGTNQMFQCETDAGRPSSRIQWYISGTNITEFATPAESTTSGNKFISSSKLTYTGNIADEGKIIYCTAENIQGQSIMSQNKSVVIWYPPRVPSIKQTPMGYVNESELIIFTCEIRGGNPLANITWECDESSQVTPTENPSTDKVVSSVQIIANKGLNGKMCTCIGKHPTWSEPKSSSQTLQIRYAPTFLPSITQTPTGIVLEGTKVILTCEISGGNPLPSISWKCNEFTIVDQTSTPSNDKVVSSIERNLTKADDGKECVCTGRHLLWTIDKNVSHRLNVSYSPSTAIPAVSQLPPGSVMENSSITLTCEIKGGKPLANIIWKCNGSSLITANSSNDKAVSNVLLIVTKDHNGDVCICTGTHPAWTENRSSNIRLNVTYAPLSSVFITQMPDGAVVEGNNVTLTCKIHGGNPLATVVWQCSRFIRVTSSGNTSTDNAFAFAEITVSKDDNGEECICRGTHFLWNQVQTNTHTLSVYYSSTIQISNSGPIRLVENNTINLVCTEKDGNPRNATFEWYKSNVTIGNEATYSIMIVTANDSGSYTCVGSNGFGNKSLATVEVDVLYSPRVSPPSVQYGNTIAENGTAVLQCTAKSNPPPYIVWMKNGSELVQGSNQNEFQSNLTIKRADCLHTSNYSCKATNTINNTKYSTFKDVELFVNCSPRQYERQDGSPKLIGLAVGENLTLLEHVLAYPRGVVKWMFKKDINSSETPIKSSSVCSTCNIFEQHICFVRLNLTENEFGLYSAVVGNDIGQATLRYTVTPQGPPYKSTNLNVTCGILKAYITWRTGFNGGEQQHFYIIVSNRDGDQSMHKTGLLGKEKGETMRYSLTMSAGPFNFVVFGNNTFGNATERSGSCLVRGVEENDSVIGLAAGLGSGMALILVITISVVIIFRKRISNKKGGKAQTLIRSGKKANEDDDDCLKDNPLYVTSNTRSVEEQGPVYSVVVKSHKTKSAMSDKYEVEHQGTVYAEVKKTDKKEKNDRNAKNMAKTAIQKGKHTAEIEMENVYSNSERFLEDNIEDGVHANEECKPERTNNSHTMYRPKKNKDGLIYADLDLDHSPGGKKFVIRGLENRTNYAILDLTVKVDPLPSDDDDEEDKENKNGDNSSNQDYTK